MYAAVVKSLAHEVMSEGVLGVVWEVGEEVVREAEQERQERLERLEKQVLGRRLRRYWKW